MNYRDFEDLPIWEEAVALAGPINQLTNKGAFARDFGLKDQIRRAATSIMANIAEGFERGSNKEFIRFLRYAKGSASEVRAHLFVAKNLNYVDEEQYEMLRNQSKTIALSIGKFIAYLKDHLEK
jgi:four helix bundle protein